MLSRAAINAYCKSLPHTTHVVQWGNSDVWKLGGRVFAVGGWADGDNAVSFKVSELGFEVLSDMPGIRPAPYLASRGMKWVQVYGDPGLGDAELKAHLEASYEMIKAKLTRKLRSELGLI
ncbi:MmcQ/YjbR family DNA-binding protein [Planktotalea arctica]|uniref:MmcQ/YjbR family DNA-binding protein n=1 Tax=Planktotalea arctica TaxID=1481893 RepID=UPI000A170EA9|nr:MmcQ/YjbR family DNA-binding protein [Planktotalea arctica]